MTDRESRKRALIAAVSQIERQFGKGAIMRLGSRSRDEVAVVPSGSLGVDLALGVGGIPRGRVTEVFGPESSGKTTLALHVVANAQRAGGAAAYIDAENALDASYARKLGVDLENLLVSQPDTGEQALEIAEALVRSSAVDVIVVDSVAALVPKAELEGEMGDVQVGLQARLMSQALRKLSAAIARSNACVIFINQLREKVGVLFGNPETTPGGRALKFYASVRLDIRRVAAIKERDEVRGSRTRVVVVKNKVAPPFRRAEFDILFGEGVSREGELVDLGLELGILERSGSWVQFGRTQLGAGRDAAKAFLKGSPSAAAALEEAIRRRVQPGAAEPAKEAAAPADEGPSRPGKVPVRRTGTESRVP